MFTKEERSTFKYWFAHWCAFQMTALNLKCWKFKYLFHDIEKPWLKIFMVYPDVQRWHRHHNNHHIEYWLDHYFNEKKMDWKAMVIDWECSHFTKEQAQLNARETLEKECVELGQRFPEGVSDYYVGIFRRNVEKVLNDLNL